MDLADQKLGNRFELKTPLGQGSYGTTYLAVDYQGAEPKECVVKQLTSHHPRIFAMFRREVMTLEKLGTHPQIPSPLDHFIEDEKLYIAQELINGHTLRDEIYSRKRQSEAYVIKLLHDVLRVLAVVHGQRMVRVCY